MEGEPSRRQYLQQISAIGAVGVTTSLAGCNDNNDSNGDVNDEGDTGGDDDFDGSDDETEETGDDNSGPDGTDTDDDSTTEVDETGDGDTTDDQETGDDDTDQDRDLPDTLTEDGLDLEAVRESITSVVTDGTYQVTGGGIELEEDGSLSTSVGLSLHGNTGQEHGLEINGRHDAKDIHESPSDGEWVSRRYYESNAEYVNINDREPERRDGSFEGFVENTLTTLDLFTDQYLENATFDTPKWDDDKGVYVVPATSFDGPTLAHGEVHVDADGVPIEVLGRIEVDDAALEGTVTLERDHLSLERPDWAQYAHAIAEQRLWTYDTQSVTIQTVFEETVIAAGGDGVYAFDRFDGTNQWVAALSGAVSSSSVADGIVYVSTDTGDLYAISADDGSEYWHESVRDGLSAITLTDDSIYTTGEDDTIWAFERDTGRYRWSVSIDENTSFVADDDNVYVGDLSGTLYSLAAETGATEWTFESSTDRWIRPSFVENGMVYVGSYVGMIYAVDITDGTEQWDFWSESFTVQLGLDDGVLYVGSRDVGVFALDSSDGSELWHFETSHSISRSPVITDGAVYVIDLDTTDSVLYALSPSTGTPQWSIEIDHPLGIPETHDGSVYVGSRGGTLYMLDADTGDTVWDFDTDAWIRQSPTVIGDTIYVTRRGTGSDGISAIEPDHSIQQ